MSVYGPCVRGWVWLGPLRKVERPLFYPQKRHVPNIDIFLPGRVLLVGLPVASSFVNRIIVEGQALQYNTT